MPREVKNQEPSNWSIPVCWSWLRVWTSWTMFCWCDSIVCAVKQFRFSFFSLALLFSAWFLGDAKPFYTGQGPAVLSPEGGKGIPPGGRGRPLRRKSTRRRAGDKVRPHSWMFMRARWKGCMQRNVWQLQQSRPTIVKSRRWRRLYEDVAGLL